MEKANGTKSGLTCHWRLSSLLLLVLFVAACSGPGDSADIGDAPGEFSVTAAEAICTPGGNPAVALSWSASEGAESYELFRNGNSVADLDAETLDFTDSQGLTAGVGPEYMVQARNAVGTAETAAVTVTVPATVCTDPDDGQPGGPDEPETEPDTPPAGDVSLTATAECSPWPRANLNWSPVSGAAGYLMHRDGILVGELTSDETVYKDGDVLIGTEHAWQLTAVNDHGAATGEPVHFAVSLEDCGIAAATLSARADSSLMVDVDQNVWSWGSNAFGQLGLGYVSPEFLPVQPPGLPEIVSVAKGHMHGLGLTADGTLWGWGFAGSGALGIEYTGVVAPTEIPGLPIIRQAAGGDAHSLAVAENGTVWAWGHNGYGQLGQEMVHSEFRSATQVPGIEDAVQVFAGASSSMALLADGRLLAWGSNENGIIGLGSIAETHIPTEVTGFGSLVIDVAFGHTFSLLRTVSGDVYGLGSRRYLGIGASAGQQSTPRLLPDVSRVLDVAAGSEHALAVLEDGSVIGWGHNPYRQLGPDVDVLLSPAFVPGISGAHAVAAGQSHSLIIDGGGRVHALGDNMSNQLGWNKQSSYGNYTVHTFDFPAVPVMISGGTYHTLAVLEDGSTWAWGMNSHGQLGYPDLLSRYAPVEVPGLPAADMVAVAAGERHSLALDSDGSVWAWGRNDGGALGLGDVQPRTGPERVESLPEMTAIAAGPFHSLGLDVDGNVWAWGSNGSGRLGVEGASSYSTPQKLAFSEPASAIAAGENHSVAIIEGEVWAWGSREYGIIGDGGPVEGGQPVPVKVPGVTDVVQVAAGRTFTVAVHSNGRATSWGRTLYGALGIGEFTDEYALPTLLTGISGIAEVAAGNVFTLVRNGTGDVYGWGNSVSGALGYSSQDLVYTPKRLQVSGTARHVAATRNGGSFVVSADGQVYVTGNDFYGQLGMGRLTFSDIPRLIEDLPVASDSD